MNANDEWVERILRVVDHVQNHLDDELEPDQLAAVAGFSRHHFHRVFRGMVGESVMGFVRRLRLERAAMRLKFGEESVTRVAFDAGYGSHEAFTRAFRSRFGVAPSKYREEKLREVDTGAEMTVRTEVERTCIGFRRVGSYAECMQAWQNVYAWAGPLGVIPQITDSLGLCYDDPDVTDSGKLRYDACIALPRETLAGLTSLPAGFSRRSISPGRYAVALHRGGYDDIDDTYIALLGKWLPRESVQLADEPVVERYLNSPDDTAPDDLLTEICVRLV